MKEEVAPAPSESSLLLSSALERIVHELQVEVRKLKAEMKQVNENQVTFQAEIQLLTANQNITKNGAKNINAAITTPNSGGDDLAAVSKPTNGESKEEFTTPNENKNKNSTIVNIPTTTITDTPLNNDKAIRSINNQSLNAYGTRFDSLEERAASLSNDDDGDAKDEDKDNDASNRNKNVEILTGEQGKILSARRARGSRIRTSRHSGHSHGHGHGHIFKIPSM